MEFICYDPSSEPSHRDEGSKHMFLYKINKKSFQIITLYSLLSGALIGIMILAIILVGWLVVLGLTALSDSISVYIGPSPKKREKEESKKVQTTPTSTYCKRNKPLPYYHPNCRTPRHWKFTQDRRTTRPTTPILLVKSYTVTIQTYYWRVCYHNDDITIV